MTDDARKPKSDVQSSFHANAASASHHSSIVAYLASAYITIVAVFSGSAFTSGFNFLTSEQGAGLLKTVLFWAAMGYVFFFGLSFALIIFVTLIVINFSFRSWDDHRSAIYGKHSFPDTHMKTKGGTAATVLATLSFMLMLAGMTCGGIIMLSGGWR